jgi:hypothetical protein
MKIKSNLVTLLAGAALGAVAVLSIAAASTETLSYGRFQLLATDNILFKIDTNTGQIWRTSVNSPSKEFMQPNIGAPTAATTNPVPPGLEKNVVK